jgi:hypothetical protein
MNFPTGKKVFRIKTWRKIELQDLADKETQKRILDLIDRDEARETHKKGRLGRYPALGASVLGRSTGFEYGATNLKNRGRSLRLLK